MTAKFEPKDGTCYLGIYEADCASMKTYLTETGKSVAIKVCYTKFSEQDSLFNPKGCYMQGYTPLVSWLPDTLDDIIGGKHDQYISNQAALCKEYNKPVFIRFGHEMNGNWFAWGRQQSKYIKAYQYIWNIFKNTGVTNVAWVWCPNYMNTGYANYYPGDAYVDWVGIDIYSKSPIGKLVSKALPAFVKEFGHKPIIICEVAGSERSTINKINFINDLFAYVNKTSSIKAICWFDCNSKTNGLPQTQVLNSSPAVLKAYVANISNPRYITSI